MFIILMAFGIIYFKSIDMAWMIILGEFFLGGAGHFLEFFGLSLRSMLVFTFVALWVLHHASVKALRHMLHIRHRLFYLFIPFGIAITASVVLGIVHNHAFLNVIRDAIPFSFFILLLPFYYYVQKSTTQEYLIRLLLVFILGSALFSLFVFIVYSGGLGILQDTFYHWFRDVAMGKITNMGTGFFRIVTPEHLLIVPATLLISSLLIRDELHHKLWRIFLFLSLMILVLDFSRTYFLALAVGMICLKYKHSWKRWSIITATAMLLTLLIFTNISLLASGGKTLGLELFGVRFGSVLEPELEPSTYTRTALLPPIFDQIQEHPILGSGLGATISFYDPVRLQNIKTPQFDWGYLELYTELGLFGFVSFLAIIMMIIFELVIKIESLSDYHDFYVGILGGAIALLVMTLTSPALFHVLGIFYLVMTLTLAIKPVGIFDKILTYLYRTFHRIKD
jgi:O-antigen ligase